MKQIRAEAAWTQVKLAELIGMSKDAVVSWETGRNRMSRGSALRISARLRRNIIAGTGAPVTVEELIQPRVQAYERRLRRRLGVE